MELRPSGDLFFPRDGETGWQVNGDAAIHIGQGGGLYAGGGSPSRIPAEATPRRDTTSSSASVPRADRTTKPFAEFRWTFVNDTSPFRLALGFNYRLSD